MLEAAPSLQARRCPPRTAVCIGHAVGRPARGERCVAGSSTHRKIISDFSEHLITTRQFIQPRQCGGSVAATTVGGEQLLFEYQEFIPAAGCLGARRRYLVMVEASLAGNQDLEW